MAIITGTDGDDKEPNELEGTNLVDQIFGLAGDDTLVGFDGDDLLEGGAGADELFGSGGFDYASYRGSSAGVYVQLHSGQTGLGFGGDAQGDHLYSIEGLIGSAHHDSLYGGDARNVLRGEGDGDDIFGYGGNDRLEGGGGTDYLFGGAGADELRGGSGTDYASYGYSAQAVRIDLAAGTGVGGEAEGDRLLSVENLFGSSYNDRLAGNDGANALEGMQGADVLVGRGGGDRFVYELKSDSMPEAPDRILDFSRTQGDKIHLAYIDANEQVSDDQAFQFIGQGQFTGAGQLRWYQSNGDTIVEANTSDATAGPEMTIKIDPLVSLQSTDFLL